MLKKIILICEICGNKKQLVELLRQFTIVRVMAKKLLNLLAT